MGDAATQDRSTSLSIDAVKAAAAGIARSAAATYAPSGVRVSAVAPGLVDPPPAARALATGQVVGISTVKARA